MYNRKEITRKIIEEKINIKLVVSAVFILLLTILLAINSAVNNIIVNVYYIISVIGLLNLSIKYSTTLGIDIGDKKINGYYNLLDLLYVFVVACTFFQFIFTFVIFPAKIVGPSMEQTYFEGELVLVTPTNNIERSDIVIIDTKRTHDRLIIKRVIAVAGDTFYFKDNILYLNGKMVIEDYLGSYTNDFKIDDFKKCDGIIYDEIKNCYVVALDYYFVMGDNRAHSSDSRDYGPYEAEKIVGKVKYNINSLFSWEKVE